MVRALNIPMDDTDYERLEAKKKELNMSWRDFVMQLVSGDNNGSTGKS